MSVRSNEVCSFWQNDLEGPGGFKKGGEKNGKCRIQNNNFYGALFKILECDLYRRRLDTQYLIDFLQELAVCHIYEKYIMKLKTSRRCQRYGCRFPRNRLVHISDRVKNYPSQIIAVFWIHPERQFWMFNFTGGINLISTSKRTEGINLRGIKIERIVDVS